MELATSGIRLPYDDTGPAGRVPVVFLHGFPFNRSMWDPQWSALAGQYRLVRFDQRGHGETGAAGGPFTLETLVDDLSGLLDQLRTRQAVLCGLSMGGYVALRFCERHPDRTRALILADTRSAADTDAVRISRAKSVKTVMEQSISNFAEGFLDGALGPEASARASPTRETVRQMILRNSPEGIAATLVALAARTDTTSALAGFSMPTLVLVGELDRITTPPDAEALARGIRNSRIVRIPQAGHLSNLENPTAFNAALRGFLESLSI